MLALRLLSSFLAPFNEKAALPQMPTCKIKLKYVFIYQTNKS